MRGSARVPIPRGISIGRKNKDAKGAGEIAGIAMGADSRRQLADRHPPGRGDFLERVPELGFERNTRAAPINKKRMIFHINKASNTHNTHVLFIINK